MSPFLQDWLNSNPASNFEEQVTYAAKENQIEREYLQSNKTKLLYM
jgi:hypothetical protein